jgi:hypothetical protein
VEDLGELPAASGRGPLAKATEWDGGYYIGDEPGTPQIGDLRVRFLVARPADVSVVGRQTGASVGPYVAASGTEILRIEPGIVPADVMFQRAADEDVLLAWMLRAGGFLAMLVGLALIFRVLAVFMDAAPRLGRLVSAGAGLTALALSVVLTLATLGLAWLHYRPLLGGAALVAATALFVLFRWHAGRRSRASVAPAAGCELHGNA